MFMRHRLNSSSLFLNFMFYIYVYEPFDSLISGTILWNLDHNYGCQIYWSWTHERAMLRSDIHSTLINVVKLLHTEWQNMMGGCQMLAHHTNDIKTVDVNPQHRLWFLDVKEKIILAPMEFNWKKETVQKTWAFCHVVVTKHSPCRVVKERLKWSTVVLIGTGTSWLYFVII